MAKENEVIELTIRVSTKDSDYIIDRVKTMRKYEDIIFELNNKNYDFLVIDNYIYNKKRIISIDKR